MRKFIPLLLLTLACNATSLIATPTPIPTRTPTPTKTPTATIIPTVAPTPTAPPAFNAKHDLYIESTDIILHPDTAIYSGDVVSIEAIVHDGANADLKNIDAVLYINNQQVAKERAYTHGLGRRLEASFEWVWHTDGLEGVQSIRVEIDPEDKIKIGDEDLTNNTAELKVKLQSRLDLPFKEIGVKWLKAEVECCEINYLANSPAARDIEKIKETVQREVEYAQKKINRTPTKKIVFNFIDRVLGHGGFASDTITITYVDRDYPAGLMASVVRHEATHVLDRQLPGKARPTMIEEGFATYIAGGHFKFEPFAPRAAGLIETNRYIPLAKLADNFYPLQHEVGYLEGASLIEYLIQTYGWEKFLDLLGSFQQSRSDSAILDAGLRATYNKKLTEIESDYLAYLKTKTDPRWTRDIEDTIRFYDSVRLYQNKLDPSAYYLNAWIPDIELSVKENITADYQRHPLKPINITLETMLIEADRGIDSGNYDLAEKYINAINKVLAANGDATVDPLSADHLALVEQVIAKGYEPQHITLNNTTAVISATKTNALPTPIQLQMTKVNGAWRSN